MICFCLLNGHYRLTCSTVAGTMAGVCGGMVNCQRSVILEWRCSACCTPATLCTSAAWFQAWVIIQGLKQLQMSTKVTAIFRPHTNIAIRNQSKLPRGAIGKHNFADRPAGPAKGLENCCGMARNMVTLWAVMN